MRHDMAAAAIGGKFVSQPFIPVARTHVGADEESAVIEVLRSGRLAQGPRVEAFEGALADRSGTAHAVATSNGTTALFLTLKALGIGPGDEVITSPMTFVASANAIAQTGARPVFGDIDDTLNLAPDCVEALITPRTRAIMPVHLHGNPCDLHALGGVAQRHGLALVQDACQAIGATVDGRPLGAFGTAVYSFYATKNITCGEGGAVVTDDAVIVDHCRRLRHQAYVMDEPYVHDAVGYNFRMTEMQAAIGVCQLSKLDVITAARRENASFFDKHLDSRFFARPRVLAGSVHVYHQYVLRVMEGSGLRREAVREQLHQAGIGTAIHYPVPVHRQPAYANVMSNPCPEAERAASDMISIPVHPGVSASDRQRIVDALGEQVEAAA